MNQSPCRALAEDRSALVDGSLTPQRRERLLVHLVHCSPCRDDVAELRRLRAALRGRPDQEAPASLTPRLARIPGEEALNRRRRARRLRATAAAIAVGTTVAGAGALGYVAAPATAVAAVEDPGVRAQADLGATLAEFPLADQALGAVLRADAADLKGTVPSGSLGPAATGSQPLDAAGAAAVLRRTVGATTRVSFHGVSDVSVRTPTGLVRAAVAIRSAPDQGSTADVLDASGRRVVATSSTPPSSPSRAADDTMVELVQTSYALSGWSDASAAGRGAALVQALRSDGSLAARWWVDDDTGLLLAQQTFDVEGQQLLAAGFAEVKVDPDVAVYPPVRPGVELASATMGLALANAPVLSDDGWACDEQLAGLTLVRLRSDGAAEPGAVHLTYTDGVSTLSVHEQRGVLARGPQGASWDTGLGAWTRSGTSNLATWPSGDRVFTVVTDGPPALLAAAVAALPHEETRDRTTVERIREGWITLLTD